MSSHLCDESTQCAVIIYLQRLYNQGLLDIKGLDKIKAGLFDFWREYAEDKEKYEQFDRENIFSIPFQLISKSILYGVNYTDFLDKTVKKFHGSSIELHHDVSIKEIHEEVQQDFTQLLTHKRLGTLELGQIYLIGDKVGDSNKATDYIKLQLANIFCNADKGINAINNVPSLMETYLPMIKAVWPYISVELVEQGVARINNLHLKDTIFCFDLKKIKNDKPEIYEKLEPFFYQYLNNPNTLKPLVIEEETACSNVASFIQFYTSLKNKQRGFKTILREILKTHYSKNTAEIALAHAEREKKEEKAPIIFFRTSATGTVLPLPSQAAQIKNRLGDPSELSAYKNCMILKSEINKDLPDKLIEQPLVATDIEYGITSGNETCLIVNSFNEPAPRLQRSSISNAKRYSYNTKAIADLKVIAVDEVDKGLNPESKIYPVMYEILNNIGAKEGIKAIATGTAVNGYPSSLIPGSGLRGDYTKQAIIDTCVQADNYLGVFEIKSLLVQFILQILDEDESFREYIRRTVDAFDSLVKQKKKNNGSDTIDIQEVVKDITQKLSSLFENHYFSINPTLVDEIRNSDLDQLSNELYVLLSATVSELNKIGISPLKVSDEMIQSYIINSIKGTSLVKKEPGTYHPQGLVQIAGNGFNANSRENLKNISLKHGEEKIREKTHITDLAIYRENFPGNEKKSQSRYSISQFFQNTNLNYRVMQDLFLKGYQEKYFISSFKQLFEENFSIFISSFSKQTNVELRDNNLNAISASTGLKNNDILTLVANSKKTNDSNSDSMERFMSNLIIANFDHDELLIRGKRVKQIYNENKHLDRSEWPELALKYELFSKLLLIFKENILDRIGHIKASSSSAHMFSLGGGKTKFIMPFIVIPSFKNSASEINLDSLKFDETGKPSIVPAFAFNCTFKKELWDILFDNPSENKGFTYRYKIGVKEEEDLIDIVSSKGYENEYRDAIANDMSTLIAPSRTMGMVIALYDNLSILLQKQKNDGCQNRIQVLIRITNPEIKEAIKRLNLNTLEKHNILIKTTSHFNSLDLEIKSSAKKATDYKKIHHAAFRAIKQNPILMEKLLKNDTLLIERAEKESSFLKRIILESALKNEALKNEKIALFCNSSKPIYMVFSTGKAISRGVDLSTTDKSILVGYYTDGKEGAQLSDRGFHMNKHEVYISYFGGGRNGRLLFSPGSRLDADKKCALGINAIGVKTDQEFFDRVGEGNLIADETKIHTLLQEGKLITSDTITQQKNYNLLNKITFIEEAMKGKETDVLKNNFKSIFSPNKRFLTIHEEERGGEGITISTLAKKRILDF